jgi:hypothetical protein
VPGPALSPQLDRPQCPAIIDTIKKVNCQVDDDQQKKKNVHIIFLYTIVKEKVTDLAIISIEKEIADQLKYDDIIDKFEDIKCRKLYF